MPYIIEQLRLARLSFELFGALSPSEARPPPGMDFEQDKSKESSKEDVTGGETKSKSRNVSQAELESSLYRVGDSTNSLLSDVILKV